MLSRGLRGWDFLAQNKQVREWFNVFKNTHKPHFYK